VFITSGCLTLKKGKEPTGAEIALAVIHNISYMINLKLNYTPI
jgi:hypothetical protein